MSDPLNGLDAYITEAMKTWQVPGAAVAVVKGDEVLHCAGYGVRNNETGAPVTPDTNFAIASMTKPFTAMGVGLLVDEGKASWDTPVREYLPSFKLKDAYASENITLRDMLSHRSGLPRHDFVWYKTPFTRAEIVQRARHHEPNKTFRAGWEYNNVMFITAGYLTEVISGVSWETHLQQRILDPLGMKNTFFNPRDAGASDQYAVPYRIKREKNQPDVLDAFDFFSATANGPEGGLYSTLSDLVTWLKVYLNGGRSGDVQLVSPATLAELRKPSMVVPAGGSYEKLFGTNISTYGLGWFVEPYRQYTIVHHGGNLDGFSLMLSYIPQANIGSVILTNINVRPLRDVLTYEIYDRLLGLGDHDWKGKYQAIWSEYDKGEDQNRETSDFDRVPETTPSHPLTAYTGRFANEGYADFEVKLENDQLYGWIIGDWWPLKFYHYDTFELDLSKVGVRIKISFQTDLRGDIASVMLPIEPAVKAIVFQRKALQLTEADLDTVVGVYDFPFEGMVLTVQKKAGQTLFAQLTGQGQMELIPYKQAGNSLEFLVKGEPSLAIGFVQENSGRIALIKQAEMTYRAPRLPD